MDTYPTKREKENHRLKMPFFGGYVSSQEGMYCNINLCILMYASKDTIYIYHMNIGPSDQKNDITINMRKKLWYFFLSMNTLTMSLQETQPRTHINVFSECFPRAGVWIIDDLRCPQSVVPLTRCHNNLSNLTLKGEGVRQQPNMKHFSNWIDWFCSQQMFAWKWT